MATPSLDEVLLAALRTFLVSLKPGEQREMSIATMSKQLIDNGVDINFALQLGPRIESGGPLFDVWIGAFRSGVFINETNDHAGALAAEKATEVDDSVLPITIRGVSPPILTSTLPMEPSSEESTTQPVEHTSYSTRPIESFTGALPPVPTLAASSASSSQSPQPQPPPWLQSSHSSYSSSQPQSSLQSSQSQSSALPEVPTGIRSTSTDQGSIVETPALPAGLTLQHILAIQQAFPMGLQGFQQLAPTDEASQALVQVLQQQV